MSERLIWGHRSKTDDHRSFWLAGRWWLHIGRNVVHAEWNIPFRNWGLGLRINDEDGFLFNFCGLYLGVYVHALRSLYFRFHAHDLGIRFFDRAVWVDLFAYEHAHSFEPDKSFWRREKRRFSWHPLDTFLGPHAYTEKIVHEEPVTICMPEARYTGTARVRDCRWKRPRWPLARRVRRVSIDMDENHAVPIPGKGTTSYNCGQDAIHGHSSANDTVEAAIASLVGSALQARKKYGGRDWVPEEHRA